jgi:signal transduction histidine kinase
VRPSSLPELEPLCGPPRSQPARRKPETFCHFHEDLLKGLLEKSEQQKLRISRDLNDSLCQEIAAASMFCSVLTKRRGIPKPVAKDLKVIIQLLGSMMRQARQIIRDLTPVQFDDFGLVVALEDLSAAINRFVACQFLCPAPIRVADNTVSSNLYEIAQNTIDFLLTHCKPTNILIHLCRKGPQMLLDITCDGHKPPGKQTRVIEHHAKCIQATLRIISPKKGGAKMVCTVAFPLL